MRRLLVTLSALFAACGPRDRGFEGAFTGTYQGERVTLILKLDGATLSGAMQWAGVRALVSGSVEGKRAKGTVRQPVMGVEVPFDATIEGDTIEWTYTYVASGQKIPLTLTRTAELEAGGPVDPQLVGRWSGGDDASTWVFNADGTFERATARGHWKCEGQFVYTRDDDGGWTALGRYVLSGGDLTIYGPRDSKQVLRRK